MNRDRATRLLNLTRPRVLVVGDALTDVDIHGRYVRISPESAGCPVFAEESREERPGGAGAVAAMTAALGADVVLLTAPQVSVKCRYFVDGRPVLRSDRDADKPTAPEIAGLAFRVEDAVKRADVVLLADYGKGACQYAVTRAAIEAAARRGIPCLVDPARGVDWRTYRGASAIKCNATEWATAGTTEHTARVLVTSGTGGIAEHVHGCTPDLYPTQPRTVADVTGAGDAVLATLGVCVAGGMDWPDAVAVANAAAGLKVTRRGAVPVSRLDVVADLIDGEKVLPLSLLRACLESRRAAGQRIAFTNGCFDVLHAGHVQSLQDARQQGDCLVVGLNSDASVSRLKGAARPIHTAEHRAAVLAGLSGVDFVAVFDADTPADLIRELRPDVLVKGDDYRAGEVAGADLVTASGGHVHFSERVPGLSTTATITKMEVARCPVSHL